MANKMANITLSKVFAALPQADRGESVRLGGDPSGENIVYCNGLNVYIRNLKDTSQVDIFTGHSKLTTVARYSPSRLFIASADVSGKVIVWDAVNPDHPVRVEHQALKGLVKDLDWSPDSLYIVVCGYSKERNASVFSVDDGNCCGTVEGHNKLINTCSYCQARPFAIVTASEDNMVGFHLGPPFHFKALMQFHHHFALVARCSRKGHVVLSGGADGRLFKYDIKKLDQSEVTEIGSPAHKADIYELCFSPDDKSVLTVSADKTAKVFDVQSETLLREFVLGKSSKDWQNTQLGCVWQNEHLLTVNACGHFTFHSMDDPQQPQRVVKGHMKPITSLAVHEDSCTIFTGSQECIMWWNVKTGRSCQVKGSQLPGDLVDMVLHGNHLVYVCANQVVKFLKFAAGLDTFCCSCSSGSNTCEMEINVIVDKQVTLDSAPAALDACNDYVLVACHDHLLLLEGTEKVSTLTVKAPCTCVHIHPGGTVAAVGHMDRRLRVYWIYKSFLREIREVEMHTAVSALAYSPCGAHLAVGAYNRVSALTATDYKELSKREIHSARVCCLAWSPDSSLFISAALDGKVVLWDDVNDSYRSKPSILAHAKSHANRVAWLTNTTFVTVGQDSNIKQFSVTV